MDLSGGDTAQLAARGLHNRRCQIGRHAFLPWYKSAQSSRPVARTEPRRGGAPVAQSSEAKAGSPIAIACRPMQPQCRPVFNQEDDRRPDFEMTSNASADRLAARRPASPVRVIVAASIGNALEWFDFLIYG